MIAILILALLKPISAEVYPKVAMVNPYKRTSFHLRWLVEPNPDNRRWSIAFTCGAEVHSAQWEIDGKSPRAWDRFVEVKVLEDCSFTACVVRVKDGKLKQFCDQTTVSTGGSP